MRSVLRISDQVAGQLPDRCVLTGEPTESLLKVRAVSAAVPEALADAVGGPLRLGRPVAVPVHPDALSGYRRRQSRWAGVAAAGLALVVVGAVGGSLPWVGILALVVGVVGSARTRRRDWIQIRQKRNADELVVVRSHPAFDEQARRLHERALRRGG